MFDDQTKLDAFAKAVDAAMNEHYLRGYAKAAHQGLLASGKWRHEEHADLVTRA